VCRILVAYAPDSYSNALFCFEELLLLAPENHHFCTRYAETLYTIGGTKNLRLARKYFARSLELHSHGNLRAAYGLLVVSVLSRYVQTLSSTEFSQAVQASANLLKGKKDKEKERVALSETYKWISELIWKKYKQDCPEKIKVVTPCLELLTPSAQ
jgi:cytochrome c-type biogenesis protein CcmH/NrfG